MSTTTDLKKELAKALLDSCISAPYLYLTEFGRYLKTPKGKTSLIPMDALLRMVENAPKEAHEAAYYDKIERFPVGKSYEDMFDELVSTGLFNFENIWGEDGKQSGSSAWVRVKTEKGFKVVYAKFMRMSKVNSIQKEYNLSEKLSRLLSNAKGKKDLPYLDNVTKKADEIRKQLLEVRLLNFTGMIPMVAKYQKSKSVSVIIPATECQVIEDQDMYERFEQSKKSPDIKVKTIYDKNTADQVHYMRQRGISKQRAEVLANLEGTSIEYNLEAMFEKQSRLEI